MKTRGYHLVLTASRAEMSDYGLDPFAAFTCTFPHRLLPKKYLEGWFVPRCNDDGSARFAPYGLRKVESMLVDEFGEDELVVTHPDHLHRFVGPDTRAILISSMDPMGLAYVSTTYNSLIGFGGEALNASEFRRLMEDPVIAKSRAT